MSHLSDNETLIDTLLREQQELSAVELFSARHSSHEKPALESYYRDLIPLSGPGKGEQYAFEVDLDKCSGCKACVTACHSLNGLDEDETWRDIGQLLTGPAAKPVTQTITTACHHCAEPGCMTGCPVKAYEKDEATGIVRHLDDQCIGCQYCSLMCPYDVPKYSKKRGIVRKCDMCYSRLSNGEAPACVQGCPNAAITIRVIPKVELGRRAAEGVFLTGAPSPRVTTPSTIYTTSREFISGPLWGEPEEIKPAADHWPLVFMLVLMQAAAGVATVNFALQKGSDNRATYIALILCMAALAVSMAHLGRPAGAWRWFLGLKTSWLSREIAAFSLFAGALSALTGAVFIQFVPKLTPILAGVTAATGLIATLTSVFVYAVTKREFWRVRLTAPKFFLSTLLLGSAIVWALNPSVIFGVSTAVFALLKLASESTERLKGSAALHRSKRLLTEHLGAQTRIRACLLLVGGIIMPLVATMLNAPAIVPLICLVALVVGESMERRLFFRAMAQGGMPGL
jgi:formate dehydrogenase iron-sulfur subunit